MSDSPNALSRVQLQFDPTDGLLYGSVEAGAPESEMDAARFQALIDESGWQALQPIEEAFGQVVQACMSGQPLAKLPLARRLDASAELKLSADGLAAYLDIAPAWGGARVTKSDVLALVAEKGISEGVRVERINEAIAAGSAESVLIATGRAPVHGKDGWFERLVPEVRSRVPKVNESGQTDYRELGDILVVHENDALMRCHPPGAGVDGVTVTGTVLPARPGKPLKFAAHLAGAKTSAEDPSLLCAEIAGQPVEVKGGMMVEPVFAINSVNMASGNLHFEGSICIRGDVSAGMTVQASGDIEIGGTAEPCVLKAGGNIVIKGGAMGSAGRKDAASWHIHCGGCFSAAYAQQAHIEAGDSIFIDDTAMQCELSAGRHIRVGNRRRGHIIGGHLIATLSITGKVLGSPNRVATTMEIGISPEINKRIHALAAQRDDKENQLLDVSKLIAFASQHPERVPAEMLERARQTAALLSAEIEGLRDEENGLGQVVQLANEARVIAEQAMHEGVTVQFGTQRFRVSGQRGPGTIGIGPHGLEILVPQDSVG